MGSARTALVAWLSTRRAGGQFVWRVEDLDPPRTVAGTAEAALNDLAWLGLDWDEGPDAGGPHAPYVQSQRGDRYELALRQLANAGQLFPCRRSRKDLRSLASAPHGADGVPPYPKRWRPRTLDGDWFEHIPQQQAALRFCTDSRVMRFDDLVLGAIEQRVAQQVGDFVLQRRDGLYAYQLAVVVDDLAMGITEVVRGTDLVESTGRQLQLIDALGGNAPTYAHVPMIVDAEGEKLSKRDRSLTLAALRDAGVASRQLVGYLAASLGLLEQPDPVSPGDLIERFDWSRIRRDDWRLPVDPTRALLRQQSASRSA